MTQTQWLIIIICGVVLSLIVRIIREVIKSRREKPVYRALADSLNFTLSEHPGMESLPRKDEFFLFSGKSSQSVPILLSGTIENVEVRILDYSYSTFSATQERQLPSKLQTLALFQCPDHRWPDSMMRPDSFAMKLPKMLGVRDIDFDDAPEFSKRYFLSGSDDAAIRGVFRKEVTDAFARRTGWCMEAHGDVIAFWRKDKRIPPKKIRPFLEEAIGLLRLLARNLEPPNGGLPRPLPHSWNTMGQSGVLDYSDSLRNEWSVAK